MCVRPDWIALLASDYSSDYLPDSMILWQLRTKEWGAGKRERLNEMLEEANRKAIERAFGDHTPQREIAANLHMSFTTIVKANRALAAGQPIPASRPRGRPSKLTPEIIAQVHLATTEDPHLGSRKLAKIITDKTGTSISAQMVNAIRHNLHFRWAKARICPVITPIQEEKRVNFSHEHLTGAIDWTKDVIISDESRFGLYCDSRSLWMQRGVYNERTFHPLPKHDSSIMVWGAIGWNYKSKLIVVVGTLNGKRYRKMLKDNGVFDDMRAHFAQNEDGRPGYFQQDGAPAHRAKKTMKCLLKRVNVIDGWPPNSPDLSPIENVWGILKVRIAARGPSTVEELGQMLQEEWDKLEIDVINRLMASIPGRFQLCIAQEGKSISHLVRNKGYKEGTEQDEAPATRYNGFAVHELKVTHAETTTRVLGQVTAIRDDKMNPSMIWVELEDTQSVLKKGYRRTIGMMAHAEDREIFRVGEQEAFMVEVHVAHPQYIGDPAIQRTVLKPMKLYLRFVAKEDLQVAEEPPPALDDCDDPIEDDVE
jgi:transposase